MPGTLPDLQTPWHAIEAARVAAAFGSGPSGLSETLASERLIAQGENVLPRGRRRGPLLRFLAQFRNTLIYFLLAGALAAALLGHLADAAVIVAVVVVNAVIGFVQEGRAERALEAIQDIVAQQADVVRGGERKRIPVRQIALGDAVVIEAGDRVPADLRLLRARRLLIDEALLTGESVAAEKEDVVGAADAALGDRRGMAFSGTLVAAGQALGIAVATGAATEIGKISTLLESVEPLTTPLLQQIDRFARRFTWFVLAGGALLFAFAVLARGYDLADALIAVVALAVGIVPEGLPAVITITLAIGVRRMAQRNAAIRKLPAVETLGATSVICTDKTGTLTRNEMTARHVVTPTHQLAITGSGYDPDGTIEAETGDDAEALAAALPLLRCGLLCNDASLHAGEGTWSVTGDPMEGALLALGMKGGLDAAHLRSEWPRLDEIPFDAAYRFMATLHRSPQGGSVAFVKGAPEAVLQMADGADTTFWAEALEAAASRGERVLAFGRKPLGRAGELAFEMLAEGVELLGLVGFLDPPRAEAAEAIAECRSAGIAVKMITGDHAATALAIARAVGFPEPIAALTGSEIDGLDDAALHGRVGDVSLFARTSPEHKLRIIRALQEHGLTVAMTGDGVNDAPSLRQADIGVAMGVKGTEASKEAADMVLLDDNFASIVRAVREGRTVFDNIRKVITWELPSNGGETLAVVLAILVGFALPMSAIQILWINLVLTATLGLVLAFEPTEPGIMMRPPRPRDTPLLSPFMLWRVALVSVLLAAAALGVFFLVLGQGRGLEVARTLVVNVFVVCEIFYLFNVRYLRGTSLSLKGMLGTPAVLVAIGVLVTAQVLFTYAPFMNALFETRPLGVLDIALIVVIGVTLMAFLELEKLVVRRLDWFIELRT